MADAISDGVNGDTVPTVSHHTITAANDGGRAMQKPPAPVCDWRKQMSNTVAYALLAYTTLQISVTMQVLGDRSTSLLPLFALIILVGGIIPLFRHYERHWEGLSAQAAADPQLKPLFRRDQLSVWLFAIGLPFAITGVYKAIVALMV